MLISAKSAALAHYYATQLRHQFMINAIEDKLWAILFQRVIVTAMVARELRRKKERMNRMNMIGKGKIKLLIKSYH